MRRKPYALVPIVASVCLAACVHLPTGPNVMVLPGTGKSFEQFIADDGACRRWAAQQAGITTAQASNEAAISGAAVGTAVGAASGAAIGAASGSPATGAAVGAGVGLLGGAAVGADRAEAARWSVQHRYDMAYMQCMYAMGNQIPIPRGSQPMYTYAWPPAGTRADVPPPPPGAPPPPPPGLSR